MISPGLFPYVLQLRGNLQKAKPENRKNHQLLLLPQLQILHRRHRRREHHEVRNDVHDGRQVPHRQGVDALAHAAGDEDGDGHAGHADEDLLRDAPDGEEDEEDEADDAGAALGEDSAVLEEEGHFCYDLGEVVDDHAKEEGLPERLVFSALQEDFILE